MPESIEYWSETNIGLDRVGLHIYRPNMETWLVSVVTRHIAEIEGWYPLYGKKLVNLADNRLLSTLHFSPRKIKEQVFDIFDFGPHYAFKLDLSEQGYADCLQKLKDDFKNYIFPTLDKYDNVRAIDRFLHDDIDRLEKDPLAYYQSKGWLMDYHHLFIRSLYIAQLAGNPDQHRIYERNKEFLLPFTGQGSETNDNILEALKKVYKK